MSVKGFVFGTAFGAAAAAGATYALTRTCEAEVRGYLDMVDLTADQRCKVETIRESFLPRVEGIRREICLLRSELADLLFASPLARDRISAVEDEIARLQRRLDQEVIDHIVEERALLTPDQQRQFHRVVAEQFRSGGLGIHDVPARRVRRGSRLLGH